MTTAISLGKDGRPLSIEEQTTDTRFWLAPGTSKSACCLYSFSRQLANLHLSGLLLRAASAAHLSARIRRIHPR